MRIDCTRRVGSTRAFREFARDGHAVPPEDLDITLDASVSYFMQPDRLLLALRNGDLCVCRPRVPTPMTVS